MLVASRVNASVCISCLGMHKRICIAIYTIDCFLNCRMRLLLPKSSTGSGKLLHGKVPHYAVFLFAGTCRTSPPPIVPTHKDLMNKVGAVIPAKWRSVGIELGLHPDQLETIEREQNGILAQCFSAVFHKWECDITSPYSWQTIIAVLKAQQVGEKRLAKTLEDHLNAVAIQV